MSARSTQRTSVPAWVPQGVRFVVVGALQTGLNVGCFAVVHGLGAPYRAAAVVAGIVTFVAGFLLNRHWTFSRRRSAAIRCHAVRYTCVVVGAIGLGVLLLTFFVEVVGIAPVPAQVLAILVTAPASFLAQRSWVFGDAER